MTTLAVAQLGAPTAVVNRTLQGFVEETGPCQVLGCRGGPLGLLRGDLRPLRLSAEGDPLTERSDALVLTPGTAAAPGAFLGAGRHRFAEPELGAVVDGLLSAGVDGLALIGGNGTMYLADQLDRTAARRPGQRLSVVGVPKTVDNDVAGTDHSPGFPSAARFLGQAVCALALDQRAMVSIEQVRVVETLGRDSGWLALSTLSARPVAGGAPHLVYLPERPFDEASFLDDVSSNVARHGSVLVVVAEGTSTGTGPSQFDNPVFDRPLSGGVAPGLAKLVEERLGLGCRAEVLGLLQRCATWAVSAVDRQEAYTLGAEAARRLLGGDSGVMVGLPERGGGPPAATAPTVVPLGDVAGRTKRVPSKWVPAPEGESEEFLQWLTPLVADGEADDR
ncbi:MAG TPA: 6-phosphofructokinase [Acidimicrobiales bacterium]|nr:6-phosphofructokinase [Acidimicrobiales bacterium]